MKPLLILLTVLLVACGGAEAKKAPDTVAARAGNAEGLPPPDHPQFMFSHLTARFPYPDTSNMKATRTVFSFDLQTGKTYKLAEYGGVDGYPMDASLRGKHLMLATSTHVTIADSDGRNPREVYRSSANPNDDVVLYYLQNHITDAALSPDGSKVAIMQNGGPNRGPGNEATLVFVDVVSGRELSRMARSAPAFADFKGYPVWVHWRADSKAVVVTGAISNHVPGGVATVETSGKVKIHDVYGGVNISPAGSRVADGTDRETCGLMAVGHTLELKDLATGRVLASVSDDSKEFTPGTWSPDGSEFLYQEFDYADATCPQPGRHGLLKASGGAPAPVTDPMQVYDRWYGKKLVTLACAWGETAIVGDWGGKQRRFCGDGQAAELRLAHKAVAQIPADPDYVEVVGFINY